MNITKYNKYIKYVLLSVVVLTLLFLIIKISKEYFKDGQYILKQLGGDKKNIINEASMQVLFANEGMAPRVYDVFSCDGGEGSGYKIVSEKMDMDLHKYLYCNVGNLNLREWLSTYLQVWNKIQNALNDLNRREIYHQDVWASNIVVDLDRNARIENVKLIDFGFGVLGAKNLKDDLSMDAGTILRTVIHDGKIYYFDNLARYNLIIDMHDSQILSKLLIMFEKKINDHYDQSPDKVKLQIQKRYNQLIQTINSYINLTNSYNQFIKHNSIYTYMNLYDKSKKMLTYSTNVTLFNNLYRLVELMNKLVKQGFTTPQDASKYNKVCMLLFNFLFSKIGGGLDWNIDGSSQVVNEIVKTNSFCDKVFKKIESFNYPNIDPSFTPFAPTVLVDRSDFTPFAPTVLVDTSKFTSNFVDNIVPDSKPFEFKFKLFEPSDKYTKSEKNCKNLVEHPFTYFNKDEKRCNWRKGDMIGHGHFGMTFDAYCDDDEKE